MLHFAQLIQKITLAFITNFYRVFSWKGRLKV